MSPEQQTLQASLVQAWQERALRAQETLEAAAVAPVFLRPDVVEAAERDYRRAVILANRARGGVL